MAEEVEYYAVWARCDNCKVLTTAEVVKGEKANKPLKDLTCESCGCTGHACAGFIGKVVMWKTYMCVC